MIFRALYKTGGINMDKPCKHINTPVDNNLITKHPGFDVKKDQTLADFNTTKETEMMPAQLG